MITGREPAGTGDGGRWRPRPAAALVVRLLALALPVAAGIVAGIGIARLLPPPSGVLGTVAWWAALLTGCVTAAALTERLSARLLPLAWLLRVAMAFPGRPPSRLRVAARRASTERLLERLGEARVDAEARDSAEAITRVLILVTAMQYHDGATRGHAERVRMYTDLLSAQLGYDEPARDRLRWAALLHDVGKLVVPRVILNKPGALDAEEWREIRRHPEAGAEYCRPLLGWLGPYGGGIVAHHERWDGSGYPAGLAGEEIPAAARLIAVVDAFEVMTAPRPYRERLTVAAAREELVAGAGSQFDPAMVRAFLRLGTARLLRVAGPLSALGAIGVLRPPAGLNPAVAFGALASVALAGSVGLGIIDARPPVTGAAAVATEAGAPAPGGQGGAGGGGSGSGGAEDPGGAAGDDVDGPPQPAAAAAPPAPPASAQPLLVPAEGSAGDQDGSFATSGSGGTGAGAGGGSPPAPPGGGQAPPGAAGPSPGPSPAPAPPPVPADDQSPDPGDAPSEAPSPPSSEPPAGPPPAPAPSPSPTPSASPTPSPSASPTPSPSASPTPSPSASPTPSPSPPGSPPVAEDDAFTVQRGTTTVLDVLANDSDAEDDLDPEAVTVPDQPPHGVATANADGTITYDAQPGFTGEEEFDYEVCDTAGSCATATVVLTITA